MEYYLDSINAASCANIVNGKLMIGFANAYDTDATNFRKFHLTTYTPEGSTPTPTPTTTYKFMQEGLDITSTVKSAIGAGDALTIKTVTSGGGTTTWGENRTYSSRIGTAIVEKDETLYSAVDSGGSTFNCAKSTDNGATWTTIATNIVKPTDWSYTVSGTTYYNSVTKLIATKNRLLAFSIAVSASSNFATSTFKYSTDNGVTWATSANIPISGTRIWSDVCYYNGILLIGDISYTDDGTIYMSNNEGVTWSQVSSLYGYRICHSQGKFVTLVGVEASQEYAKPTCTQVITSADGSTWSTAAYIKDITTGLPAGIFDWYDMVSDEQYVYLVGQHALDDDTVYVIRSADGGATFSLFTTFSLTYETGYSAELDLCEFASYNGEFFYSLSTVPLPF